MTNLISFSYGFCIPLVLLALIFLLCAVFAVPDKFGMHTSLVWAGSWTFFGVAILVCVTLSIWAEYH